MEDQQNNRLTTLVRKKSRPKKKKINPILFKQYELGLITSPLYISRSNASSVAAKTYTSEQTSGTYITYEHSSVIQTP